MPRGTVATFKVVPIFTFDSILQMAIFKDVQSERLDGSMRGESKFMRSTFAPASSFNAHARQPGRAPERVLADAEIARFFIELRRYLRLSIADAARRVATHPDVIAALEAGRIGALPGRNETTRVVTAYIGLAGLDPRPALDRLDVLTRAAANSAPRAQPAARPLTAVPQTSNPVNRIIGRLSQAAARAGIEAEQPAWFAEWTAHMAGTRKRLSGALQSARAPVRWVSAAALGLVVIGSVASSGVLQASVGGIAQPISGLWRKLSGEGRDVRVIVRDGLKWIEADDPRKRRSDKLPSRGS